MEREILVSADHVETRVALLESGTIVEVAIERHRDRSRVGNIYKGKVNRVLPGMQSAFLDIGLERDAFLHVTDLPLAAPPPPSTFTGPRPPVSLPPIESLIQEGQSLLVQVVKEAISGKGARVTGSVTLPARYLVLAPFTAHIGVSRKILSEAERERLKGLVQAFQENGAGYIVRTAAQGKGQVPFEEDVRYLKETWQCIQEGAKSAAAPALLHEELERPLQILRDLFGGEVSRVSVEGEAMHGRILDFVASLAPRSVGKVVRYTDPLPLFEARGVRREIKRALRNKAWLPSGGSIVINQTEALVAVDVNTGKYTGQKNLEETLLKINLEAAREIARQLRLRDLGGIIVVDFIDLEEPASRQMLFHAFRDFLARDRARIHLHELSDFGLVQITRRRARRSLERTLCQPCATCHGSGRVKTAHTVAAEILMEVRCTLAASAAGRISIRAHPRIVEIIEDEQEAFLASLGARSGLEISLFADPNIDSETFEIEPTEEEGART